MQRARAPPRRERLAKSIKPPGLHLIESAEAVLVVRQASLLAWLIASAALLAVLLAPWLLPEEVLLKAAPVCQARARRGVECPLCGMTRAFVSISKGRLHEATQLNRASVPLYVALAANELAALLVLARQASRIKPRPPAQTKATPQCAHRRA